MIFQDSLKREIIFLKCNIILKQISQIFNIVYTTDHEYNYSQITNINCKLISQKINQNKRILFE